VAHPRAGRRSPRVVIGDNGENSHAETFAPRGAGRAGNCCNERACLLLSYAATTASAATGGTAGSATAATASAARGSSLWWSDRRSERLRRRRQWRRLPLGGRFSNCRRWVSAIIALKSPRPHEVAAFAFSFGVPSEAHLPRRSRRRSRGERVRVRRWRLPHDVRSDQRCGRKKICWPQNARNQK
jgi:hypothetical protein